MLLAYMAYVGQALTAGPEIAPSDRSGLFVISEDSSPLVESHYVGWGAKWSWDGARVKVGTAGGNATPFTLRFAKLDVDADGQWQSSAQNRMAWDYEFRFNKDQNGVIGAGIEFKLKLDSPALGGAKNDPELLEGNRGWSWQYKQGETITVSFEPALANVYFERGQKQIIRAMFFTDALKAGKQPFKMTVDLPEGGTVQRSLGELYGPADTTHWFKQALDPHKSFIDLSGLNHKPAGKHGFVRAAGDRFEFEDGRPIQFWGCNVQAYSLFIKDRDLIQQHARRIAQLGFNLVRLHHHDSAGWVRDCLIAAGPTSQEIDEQALDSYFWWTKCLKDEGIYVWVDLLVGRPFREADNIPGWSDLSKHLKRGGAEAKGFNYLNSRIRKLLKDFNEQLLTRQNPHTGLALKDEPAVMALLITNENELTHHFGNTFLGDKGNPHHQKLFETKRDAFAKKYGLDNSRIGQTWVPGPSKLLLNDLEAEFNRDMVSHLRSLGVKVPISTCQMWGGTPLYSLPALTEGDIIDAHSYSGGEFLRGNPRFVPNFMHWIGHAQVAGKPLTITEYNISDGRHLNDAFTIPLYMAAMTAFQGWDAPMLYGYSQDGLRGSNTSPWSSYMHPAIAGLMPAAAVMIREGHVLPAKQTAVISPSPDVLFMTNASPRTSAAIRTALEQHRLVIAMPKTKELPWLRPSPGMPDALTIRDLNKDLLPPGQTFIETDTGEVRRDWKEGIQTINTSKSQAAIGWLKEKTVELADTTFRIRSSKAAVVLTSLDGKPLKQSGRILVSAVARVRAITEGDRQYLSEPVAGQIQLRSAVKGLDLVPLKRDAQHGPAVPLRQIDGAYVIDLPTDAGTHWFLLVE